MFDFQGFVFRLAWQMLLPKQGVEGKQGGDFVSLGCSQGYYQSSCDETEQINFQALNPICVEVGWGLFGE